MKYISTRGNAPKLNFQQVLLTGLAADGGLYVPETIPHFTPAEIASMQSLSYPELVKKIITPFIGNEISEKDLENIIKKSYSTFNHPAIAPLKQLDDNLFLLELFHGPTLAFKDFALQFLGNVLDHTLKKRNEKVVIVGATSGDTGSAAIEGCKNCKNVEIFIMHPKGKTSDIQRKQMTTVTSKNVHNIAIEGNFDDCQSIVKELFAERDFLKDHQLVAVNSINWVRIMAQIVYYFSSAIALGAPSRSVSFSVPTGNFGDIFAGYIAYRMGLPVKQLIIATNKNDILNRFVANNDYSRGKVHETLSPSMDIQISSNFERMLYYAHDENAKKINQLMAKFKTTGKLSVEKNILNNIRKIFSSLSVDDKTTVKVIKEIFATTGEVIDPHTATAIEAAKRKKSILSTPVIVLSTAHPAKFPLAVEQAGIKSAPLPNHLKNIMKLKENFRVLKNSKDLVKKFILASIS